MMLTVACLLVISTGVAQDAGRKDAPKQVKSLTKKAADSLRSFADTTYKGVKSQLKVQREQFQQSFNSKKELLTAQSIKKSLAGKDSLLFDIQNPFKQLLFTKPLLKINGGYVSYQFNYRSAIDTPYIEKDIAQHNVTGNLNVTVGGHIPLRVTFWSRQSNSAVFRDINDVQVSFDGRAFQQHLQQSLRQRLLAMSPNLRDSLTEKLYFLKQFELEQLKLKLRSFTPQDLVEAHETLKVPRITWLSNLADSINQAREDSLKKMAGLFLDLYATTKGRYDSLSRKVDSLKGLYDQNIAKIKRYQQLLNGGWRDLIATRQWTDKLRDYGMGQVQVPAKYRWLMGLRQFSVGRSVTNHSELTIKNTSVNGINFEYNSWYYLAVTAGLVDYRYRDFVINGANRKPQYLYMVRAGLGRLEKNYFILSAFRGDKQLFASNANKVSSIAVTGFSAEGRFQVNPTTYLTGEIAKSLAPDFRHSPIQGNTKFSLSDKTNQAYAIKVYSYLPQTGTKLEGTYKHTGANYQSFSSFQTNAALESWTMKAEQTFFKRKLRMTGSLRKNEFTNPLLPQNYSSNTVFKSLTASFRMRKWPSFTVGYQPMSQLTSLDSVVVENRFQVLNGSAFHTYKLGTLRTASSLVLSKYYNTNSDTAFLYYNATNVFCSQQFFFDAFTTQTAVSYTRNGSYKLVVLDGGVQLNFKRLGSVGFGVKVNSLNEDEVKAGGYFNANVRVFREDFITVSYDRGYLPGSNKGLIRNEMATVQFVKSFDF
ncbi:hypothetical protein [Paraflavitalea pollutisoli]|uniref:hypothetical protein n=1 Tax=Paraflavitalea pollutisoli TaxID=3034143 RepID=UPI0023EDABFE|nr:hypothetical protein [Paraflavitalea sp. H1-2-19X]